MRCCAVIDTNVIVAALLSKKDDAYLVTGNIIQLKILL
jgi:predicted nucleic acid-binding protein